MSGPEQYRQQGAGDFDPQLALRVMGAVRAVAQACDAPLYTHFNLALGKDVENNSRTFTLRSAYLYDAPEVSVNAHAMFVPICPPASVTTASQDILGRAGMPLPNARQSLLDTISLSADFEEHEQTVPEALLAIRGETEANYFCDPAFPQLWPKNADGMRFANVTYAFFAGAAVLRVCHWVCPEGPAYQPVAATTRAATQHELELLETGWRRRPL